MDEPPTELRQNGAPAAPADPAAPDPPVALLVRLGIDVRSLDPLQSATLRAMAEEILALRTALDDAQAATDAALALADRDSLCPVFNRRAFLRELHREIARANRYATPLTLVYLDLDGFKTVNDRFGHAIGDQVLLRVAAELKALTRESDIIGRLGGDEFAIALVHADDSVGRLRVDALRQALAGLVVRSSKPNRDRLPVTAAFGVVEWRPGLTPQALISEADLDMLAAKARNASSQARI